MSNQEKSVTGLPRFSIERTESFERSFKKLAKFYRKDAIEALIKGFEDLAADPFPPKSRDEPLPSKAQIPEGWTFHKLEIRLGKGASGQVRLMYLVNDDRRIIKPLWMYNHEQFAKRPDDPDIRAVIRTALDAAEEA
jgi:mRNA-degrading endonuclease RelE of RelBE toxin-antitoxin system